MNKSDAWIESAKDIMNAVNTAVQSEQFQNLPNQIREAVNTATEKIKTEMPKSRTDQYANPNFQRKTGNEAGGRTYTNAASSGERAYSNASTLPQDPSGTPWFQKTVDKANGSGFLIGGIVGALLCGIPFLVSLVLALTILPGFWAAFGIFGFLTVLFVLLIAKGAKKQSLTALYFSYGAIAGDKEYVTIEELSRATGRKTSQVLSDIKEMRKQNLLPYAVLDADETTVMLTEKAYREYESIHNRRTAYEKQQAMEKKELEELKDSDLPEDVKELLAEGRAYLLKVRNYNDQIPDTEPMSAKLYELENIMKRIFEQVQKEPASAKELRRFMNYYLPTTDKLLSSYTATLAQGANGENLSATRREIESAMDVINDAFEKLLDKMFESTAWDISSDISVMKTMLKQDGLTETEEEKEKVPV